MARTGTGTSAYHGKRGKSRPRQRKNPRSHFSRSPWFTISGLSTGPKRPQRSAPGPTGPPAEVCDFRQPGTGTGPPGAPSGGGGAGGRRGEPHPTPEARRKGEASAAGRARSKPSPRPPEGGKGGRKPARGAGAERSAGEARRGQAGPPQADALHKGQARDKARAPDRKPAAARGRARRQTAAARPDGARKRARGRAGARGAERRTRAERARRAGAGERSEAARQHAECAKGRREKPPGRSGPAAAGQNHRGCGPEPVDGPRGKGGGRVPLGQGRRGPGPRTWQQRHLWRVEGVSLVCRGQSRRRLHGPTGP